MCVIAINGEGLAAGDSYILTEIQPLFLNPWLPELLQIFVFSLPPKVLVSGLFASVLTYFLCRQYMYLPTDILWAKSSQIAARVLGNVKGR